MKRDKQDINFASLNCFQKVSKLKSIKTKVQRRQFYVFKHSHMNLRKFSVAFNIFYFSFFFSLIAIKQNSPNIVFFGLNSRIWSNNVIPIGINLQRCWVMAINAGCKFSIVN